jgi:hypothetical protein
VEEEVEKDSEEMLNEAEVQNNYNDFGDMIQIYLALKCKFNLKRKKI